MSASQSKWRLLPVLLLFLLSGVFFTTNIPSVLAETSTTTACALTPDVLGGQGFTVSGFGFSTSGFGFSTSGFGFSTSGFGFSTSGFGIDAKQVASDIVNNPISNAWLTELLDYVSSGDNYNSVKTAILIVDDESHGDKVAAVFEHLMLVSNASKVDIFRVNIGDANGYRTDLIAPAIQSKITELQGQGYKHFVINMSFGLVPCDDQVTVGGKSYTWDFQTMLQAIEQGNQPQGPKPVRPLLECVENLGGGQYRARFGYKNENSTSLVIPVGEKNKFYLPNPLDRGQPHIFEPGRQRNVFTVTFDGNRIQWFITGPDGVRRNVSATKYSTACSSALPNTTKAVKPVLECVADNGNGTFTARFGYQNDNTAAVRINVGANNNFHPTPQDRGQTDIFLPGRRYNVFQVTWTGGNLVWSLKGPDNQNRTATASSTNSAQACVDDVGFSLFDYLETVLKVPGPYIDDFVAEIFDNVDDELNDLRALLRDYLDQSAASNGNFQVFPVASSGNYRPWLGGAPLSPAAWDETIAVGATLGNFGNLWQFSHDGNVLAPGAGFPLGNNSFIAGTSFAAPFISTYLAHFATYPNACTFPNVGGTIFPPLVQQIKSDNAKVLDGQPSPFTCVPPQDEEEYFVCYADYVVAESYIPGTRKDGTAVLEVRRNPAKALGAPQNNDTNNFVSLGFDKPSTELREGVLTLGFENIIVNGEGNDIRIWETSFGDASRPWSNYPEKAKIYVSQYPYGPWTLIGETSDKDQAYDLVIDWAQFIKFEDTTNRSLFSGDADGFDIDAVEAYYCEDGGYYDEGGYIAGGNSTLALPGEGGRGGKTANAKTAKTSVVYARAGENLVKVDRKGKGFKNVTLDASSSYSMGAKIMSYQWVLPGYDIAPVSQPKVRLAVGTHLITLIVTDKKGSSATTTVTVTVEAGSASIGLPGMNGRQ